jgi:hypothetical protein
MTCSTHSSRNSALGATQTAVVRREAQEEEVRNANEARKKVAQYKSDADIHVQRR